MKDIDSVIRDALSKEDALMFEELREQSMPKQAIEAFRGRHGLLLMIQTLVSLVVSIFMFYAGYKAYYSELPIDATKWCAVVVVCLVMVSMIKVFFLMELSKNTLTRELKRIELQIASMKPASDLK